MKSFNDRAKAVIILNALIQDHQSLSQGFDADKNLSSLSKAICFGVCRHYYRLQAVANQLCPKRPKSALVWIVLLVGLHELIYLNQPVYATVNETVDLLVQLKQVFAKGFINATLRTFCREREAILARLQSEDAFIYGEPKWLLKRLKADWPEQWSLIALSNDAHPPMSLRVNLQKMTRDKYYQKLKALGIEARILPYSPVGLVLQTPCSVHDLPGFIEGEVSLQDEAAQLAAFLLELEPDLRVLDACAAPGGKTCHILESEPQLQSCVALDINPHRLEQVTENLTRLGLQATLLQGDAAKPSDWWDGQLFDRILLDAPCSALGVIRRHPDIKLLRQAVDIAQVVQIQHTLLRSLWPLLRRGGRLVYATCSVIPAENEGQIALFLREHSDCKLVLPEVTWGHRTGHGIQILPGEGDCDGFFYSILKKE